MRIIKGYWRGKAAGVIARVIEANPELDEPALTKKINDAYPFGPREHYPYKAWCQERKLALDRKFPKLLGSTVRRISLRDTQGTIFEGWEAKP